MHDTAQPVDDRTNARRWAGHFDRPWRIAATGFAFACFGVGAVLLGFTIWPVLRLAARDAQAGLARVRCSMNIAMRLFVWLMHSLGLLTYEVHGRDRLARRGQLIVANHPTLIDVVFLVALLPEVECVVKQALWRNPFLRWPVAWAGYISNADGPELVAACARALAAGKSLLLFPEGTRGELCQARPMKRGAAQVALAAGVDLRPVTITCEPLTLRKGTPWYRVPRSRPHWVLSVGELIAVRRWLDSGEPRPASVRHLTLALTQYFERSAELQGAAMRGRRIST